MNLEPRLTLSQTKAIEKHRKSVKNWEHIKNPSFLVYSPHNSPSQIVLVVEYDMLNALGTLTRKSQSWEIGKRGRVWQPVGVKIAS